MSRTRRTFRRRLEPRTCNRRPGGIGIIEDDIRNRLVAADPSLAHPGRRAELDSHVEAEFFDTVEVVRQYIELFGDLKTILAKHGI